MGVHKKPKIFVLLHDRGADIYKNPVNIETLKTKGVLLENPDLSPVKDVPKKYWTEKNGSLTEMNEQEKKVCDDNWGIYYNLKREAAKRQGR